jgi:hypothetical protein
MRPKVIECGACGHPDYHCPASGCNHHDDCECEVFQQVTELELGVLEKVATGRNPWPKGAPSRVTSQALARLKRKGCVVGRQAGPLERDMSIWCPYELTNSGRAVLLGTPPETLQSILGLVTENPPTVALLAALTRDQREELRDWAGREHLSASDNPVRRRLRPAWLDGLPKEVSHVGDV